MEEQAQSSKINDDHAHITWAAHILAGLTNTRKYLSPSDVSDDEENDNNESSDAATERNVILQSPKALIASKFLDCFAQLFSPSKGWSYVTATALREREDFVEIDIARNDCFGIECTQSRCEFRGKEALLCNGLRDYLSSAGSQAGRFQCWSYRAPN